jgi:hypothetical protein
LKRHRDPTHIWCEPKAGKPGMRSCIRHLRKAVIAALVAVPLAVVPAVPQAAAQAHDLLDRGVPVGTPLPHQLDVPDQDDQVRNFRALTRNRGLSLIFSRSLSW